MSFTLIIGIKFETFCFNYEQLQINYLNNNNKIEKNIKVVDIGYQNFNSLHKNFQSIYFPKTDHKVCCSSLCSKLVQYQEKQQLCSRSSSPLSKDSADKISVCWSSRYGLESSSQKWLVCWTRDIFVFNAKFNWGSCQTEGSSANLESQKAASKEAQTEDSPWFEKAYCAWIQFECWTMEWLDRAELFSSNIFANIISKLTEKELE